MKAHNMLIEHIRTVRPKRRGRRKAAEMAEIQRQFYDFMELKPSHSVMRMAVLFDVSERTINKWLDERQYKKWGV